MRCNLKCAYCHFKVRTSGDPQAYVWSAYDRDHTILAEVSWHGWILYFSQHRNYHLEFSGGEPLCYEGFSDLVSHIPSGSTWAITSNTLGNIDNIPFDRMIHWTASYHGIKDKFDDNLARLKKLGVPYSVSIVALFNNLDACIRDAYYFQRQGHRVNVLREFNPDVKWDGTKEWEELKALRNKRFNVVEEDIPASYTFERGFFCSAGRNYFCAMPDGKLYKCYSEAMRGTALGSIFDAEIPEVKNPHKCYAECMGCALDYRFRGERIKGDAGDDKQTLDVCMPEMRK